MSQVMRPINAAAPGEIPMTKTACLQSVAAFVAICLIADRSSAQKSQTASADAAAKAKIMASDDWKKMAAEYQKWLNSQAIYSPGDINRINAKLAKQMQAMSAGEMQDFLNDWLAKLKVLNGKNFQDAQQWLGEYMSALTDGYRAKTLQNLGLTDVASMSADQLQDAIERIRADQLSVQRSQVAFNRARQQQVQAIQQANVATQQAQQQAAAQLSASQFNSVQSPYRPPNSGPWNPGPQLTVPQFYVSGSGQVGYLLPF
jgi:uncharacterized protein YycO